MSEHIDGVQCHKPLNKNNLQFFAESHASHAAPRTAHPRDRPEGDSSKEQPGVRNAEDPLQMFERGVRWQITIVVAGASPEREPSSKGTGEFLERVRKGPQARRFLGRYPSEQWSEEAGWDLDRRQVPCGWRCAELALLRLRKSLNPGALPWLCGPHSNTPPWRPRGSGRRSRPAQE